MTANPETVVIKSILVHRELATAFRLWTEHIRSWWPAGHSLSGDPKTQVFLEGWVGGRFFERTSNGDELVWGHVTRWEPPYRLGHTWFLGSGQNLPSEVEVTFTPAGEGITRVEVSHRGPEHIGEVWWTIKARFHAGWEKVLGEFQHFN
ncbi:MAG: SRPBCC domain-containing protein [Anaerolineales bacterium]|nr:SRPBCC domain-containing protein [Anaerolineales bacterium]